MGTLFLSHHHHEVLLIFYSQTDDNLYALVFSMVAGTFKLSIGSSSSSTPIVPGLTKIKLALSPGSPRATLLDSAGNVVFDGSPAGYTYTATPTVYNFNYYVAGKSSRLLKGWGPVAD